MRLIEYTSEKQLDKIEKLYIEAFPEIERKPFELMVEKIGQGVEMVAIEDENGEFCGLAIMLAYGSIALLDYFAVVPEMRGRNIGSRALGLLKERYAGKVLLIEIEDTDEPSDNHADRLRRKAFYLRNGMVEMDYKVWFYGTKMQVLTNGGIVGFEAHRAVYDNVLGREVSERIVRV